MLVMSCPTNEPESCSSEGSSCTTSSITTSDPSSMSAHTRTTPQPSLSDAPDTSKHEAPPPPPLPPPPPGAPPPPPPPATTPSNHNARKKRRVRSFFWKPIPEEKVRGKPNIWTLAVRQQQYQIDVRSVEELFGQQEEAGTGVRGAMPATGTSARVSRSRSFKESSKDEISILDSKRGMNVGIFLKQFKKSNRSIVEDIRRGEGKIYGAELLKDLLKLLPDVEEVKKLQAFKGDPDKLTLVDSFMYLLIQVPRFEVRIEAIVLREEFFPSCAIMSREIDVIRVATKELMSCEELHAILHLVLQAGNIMNAGGYAGNAVGFKLSSLLSLADTKANKPGMNLLHFVAMEAKKKDEKLLRFPEKLQDVQSAARISVENIEVEFSSLYVRIRSLEEKVQGDQELLQQLEPFLQSSALTLQDLKRRRLDLRKEGNMLIDFFCEDKDTFKLDECFRIFQDFCIKFKKAVKDNMDRELKEAARQRRLRELEEKRFAWSGSDQSSGFGRSSSENDVEMLTKEGLLDFFQQRSQSPHSPLGRSASARRHRHTMTSIADRELKGYLELFGGSVNPTDYSKFNSLPRSGRAVQRRTTPWILAQDDNRELGCDRQVTSPHAETEPISPLARFSSSGLNDNDTYNNNNYSSVSEGSTLPRPFCVFQKPAHLPNPTVTGHMNVSVETHTLVRGPRAFDLPSPNNNSNHMHFVNQGDVVVTDLEKERQSHPINLDVLRHDRVLERGADPKAAWAGKMDPPTQAGVSPERDKEEEDNSTISSTTCDTPLPLDTSVSNKKPVFYVLDCTEADCSVTSDYSEVESSSLTKEGLHFRTPDSGRSDQESQQDPSSLSSNLESPNDQSTNELSAPKSADASSMTPSATEEWDTESCDTAEGKQSVDKDAQRSSRKPAHAKSKTNKATKGSGGRGVRTLTSSESQGMRKVVPISKLTRTGSSKRAEKPLANDGGESRRPLRDQSTPARGRSEKTTRPPRHSSLPPDESKGQRGSSLTGGVSRWARDSTPRKASIHKPSAKPLRNIPKPAPEEKMCRSTMRALAQAQAQAQGGASSENSSCHTTGVKNPSEVPSFARNTVASTSRTKKELAQPSVPSTPSRSPSLLSRQTPMKQNRLPPTVHTSEERPQGTNLRRVQSVKATSRSAYRSETPPPPSTRDDIRKTGSFSEKSVQSRDSATPSRGAKPSWK
ncbi:LOW QUALITY PROTEIN: FH2 domain-containing protein 1 [Plectropomus leopardus]|uniref:LOW QUALITY PROTEIN: FH2 domain-containing protein 1 n=1 Tax=Plectropomus leopardus TaxID=160734 RepID=UPI001C4D29F1|nr:LOW QUALITY PROTEIN: FH2 domain-containing protein 1 [Plectropomus leopardus]